MRKLNRGVLLLAFGIILVLAAATSYAWPRYIMPTEVKWDLTLVGDDGTEKIVSFAEIKKMPSYSGRGGEFSSAGIISGPYSIKGVPVTELCALVGGIKPDDVLLVSAQDGYSSIFSYSETQGKFITYDPKTMKEVPYRELKLVLIYEQDGAPLTHNYGKPLRIATVGPDDLLVEGHYWVKWVNRIEVAKRDGK
jgi:DMSO/TMAO reductase YedYZ molybdopterin-dependent catalytic subunit